MLRHSVVFLVLSASAVLAQSDRRLTVGVTVVDSAQAPVIGADIAVVRGAAQTLAGASTNERGRVTVSVPRAEGSLQLVVRKIGFSPSYRFFSPPTGDTLAMTIELARTAVSLETVNISAAEDRKRKSYSLDADEIANSKRPVLDGTDIFKLRPDMKTSRGGENACKCLACPPNAMFPPPDGWIESVWINGRRIRQGPAIDTKILQGVRSRVGIPQIMQSTPSRTLGASNEPPSLHPKVDTVLAILRLIKPEHIQEVTYKDCFDNTVAKTGGSMAMFVALKPGIGFADGVGSYVIDDSRATASALDVRNLPGYRFRVLGVFDVATGDPLGGVAVIDSASGNRATTTATGTVSLFFVPDGRSTIRLERAGYRDTTFAVFISPSDTVPVTATLVRRSRSP
jgi:hypothetical protein